MYDDSRLGSHALLCGNLLSGIGIVTWCAGVGRVLRDRDRERERKRERKEEEVRGKQTYTRFVASASPGMECGLSGRACDKSHPSVIPRV